MQGSADRAPETLRARKVKLCVGASAGGHLNQLLRLLEHAHLWPYPPSVYVTTLEAVAPALAARGPCHVIGEADRFHPLRAVGVVFRSLRFALRERPDVVVTTGSMPLMILCAFCKALGAKIVWVDSVANVEGMSMSGRMARRFADLVIVQWPDLPERYPGTVYAGAIV